MAPAPRASAIEILARETAPDGPLQLAGISLPQPVRPTPNDTSGVGRDVERWAPARGLRYHLEGRVLTHGNKTVVFD